MPAAGTPEDAPRRAALVTLGCARNEVDSEELAGRLTGSGWELVDADAHGPDAPDVILVNTCGFVEQAKKDSIDTLLAASDAAGETGAKVVAVGCLAERYGKELADSLPEADAVLGFDAYPELAQRLSDVLGGHPPEAHVPVDRRTLLPISPVDRPTAAVDVEIPGHAWVPNLARTRLSDGAGGQPQAGLGLRPALRVLRDPLVPRLVRLPPAGRPGRRGGLAGHARGARAGAGQRELHVVRQGPARWHPGADPAAAPARRRCPASTGSGCPTCSRPSCGRTCWR